MNSPSRWLRLLGLGWILAGLGLGTARAQWLTQTLDLRAGWNAVYLVVDPSYASIEDVVDEDPDHPIEEIWLWRPQASTSQFVQSPQLPTDTGSQWLSWNRSLGPSSSLRTLGGNAAYLVRVRSDVPTYAWNVRGRPVPPRYEWSSSGLNFLGFRTPPTTPPSFEGFLAQSPGEFQRTVEIFRYVGGELGPGNPARLFALRTTPARRGEAVWMRSGTTFNRYFGPVEVDLQNGDGLRFREISGQFSLRLRNLAPTVVTVTLALVDSEAPPAGQTPIVGTPPLLLRGEFNATNLVYGHSDLTTGSQTRVLAPMGQPGSDVEVVVGLDRSRMTGQAGDLHAGVLRLTDSLGLSQIDLPVTANVTSQAGLWVGEAEISQVRNYLKNYLRGVDGNPVVDDDGRYIVTGTNFNLGVVARPFPLRLIVHQGPGTNDAVLLQRVYHGQRFGTNLALTTQESLLDVETLRSARRITAVHLPWSAENVPWTFLGRLREGETLRTTVTTGYNDHAANPFIHTYHPDHDNLTPTFDQVAPQGEESYVIERRIALALRPPADDFASLTRSGTTLIGDYLETLAVRGSGSETREFDTLGTFVLNRVSDLPVLVLPEPVDPLTP